MIFISLWRNADKYFKNRFQVMVSKSYTHFSIKAFKFIFNRYEYHLAKG